MVRDESTERTSTKDLIELYWKRKFQSVVADPVSYRDFPLPLARIKRLMKVEQEVSKVASEVPIIFAKLTEIFVEELTLRSWMHTEENKRRILQRADICAAAKACDVFDFLIYLIPGSMNVVEKGVLQPSGPSRYEERDFGKRENAIYNNY